MSFRSRFIGRRDAATSGPKSAIRTTVTSALALFGAVILGLLGTGGTYALLNATSHLSNLSVAAGSMNLTVSNVQQDDANATQLLPGQAAFVSFDLKNVGDVPVAVTGAATTDSDFSPYLAFDLAPASSCAVLPAALTFHSLSSAVSLTRGESVQLCLRVSLSESAPQSLSGRTAPLTLTMNSTQVIEP